MCRGMVFWRYPLDQHVCSLRLSSCEYYRLGYIVAYSAHSSGGYDAQQVMINGQFSYQRSSQRDLQFFTDVREIDLRKRTWQGEESRLSVVPLVVAMISNCRELQHVWHGDPPDQVPHPLHLVSLYSLRPAGHLQPGKNI